MRKNIGGYDVKKDMTLPDEQVQAMVISPEVDEYFQEITISRLHGVNKKQVVKRRKKNKLAYKSKMRNK